MVSTFSGTTESHAHGTFDSLGRIINCKTGETYEGRDFKVINRTPYELKLEGTDAGEGHQGWRAWLDGRPLVRRGYPEAVQLIVFVALKQVEFIHSQMDGMWLTQPKVEIWKTDNTKEAKLSYASFDPTYVLTPDEVASRWGDCFHVSVGDNPNIEEFEAKWEDDTHLCY